MGDRTLFEKLRKHDDIYDVVFMQAYGHRYDDGFCA